MFSTFYSKILEFFVDRYCEPMIEFALLDYFQDGGIGTKLTGKNLYFLVEPLLVFLGKKFREMQGSG